MTVDQLLHDAEHADSGAHMARMMGDTAYVQEALQKRDRLVREAVALDPTMQDEAWEEVDPAIRALALRPERGEGQHGSR